MEAHDYLVGEVLEGNRQFLVPIYQRRYQWTEVELVPFWADVAAKADEVLEDRSHYQHYLGALIWIAAGDGLNTKLNLVDGQQRLTTIQLFLAALREVAITRNLNRVVHNIEAYLFNRRYDQSSPDDLVKIVPTPADRYLIRDIIASDRSSVRRKYPEYYFQNGNLKAGQAPRALTNYLTLFRLVDRYVRTGEYEETDRALVEPTEIEPELESTRLEALLHAIVHNLKIVVIALGEGDDAQVIFETLNSKGRPLLAMDLVKNNIFHRAEAQGEKASDLYRQLWSTFDDDFWGQPAPRARPVRPRIDHFLSHSLSAQTGRQTAIKELYAEYRGYARPAGRQRFDRVEDELRALTQYAPIYKVLEGETPGRTALSWIGKKLAAWESTIAYPVVFQVGSADIDEAQQTLSYRLIYSYLVRRAVCGLPNKSHGITFAKATTKILDQGASARVIAESLRESTASTARFPDDAEFTRALVDNPLYDFFSGGRLPDLLWELELASRSQFTEAMGRPDPLWVEHVMPQTWTDEWRDTRGEPVSKNLLDERAQRRSKAIHTLGNLTLTTDSLNISLGNDSFEKKKDKLKRESLFILNHQVCSEESWTESTIEARSLRLAQLACEVFIGPMKVG